jgi:pimeloyl-ACP methyl ester carboxylesterase
MSFALNARDHAQDVPGNGRFPDMRGDVRKLRGKRAAGVEAGGTPVLFLHGWGVGPNSYAAALGEMAALGCDVLAPAQPGFGGRPALPGEQCSFAGYARWAAGFLESSGIDEPAVVVGHSFGGGVAVQLAHDYPERASAVVLCNAVGGFPWTGGPEAATAERPWWEWGRCIGADLVALSAIGRVLPALLGEAVPNLVHNPLAMWRVGEFVRRSDLLGELGAVARSGVSVTIVWSDRDRLVPHAGFAALCRAAGVEGEVVPGGHSWLIAEPRRFADIVQRALVEAGVVESRLAAAG